MRLPVEPCIFEKSSSSYPVDKLTFIDLILLVASNSMMSWPLPPVITILSTVPPKVILLLFSSTALPSIRVEVSPAF